MHSIHMARLFLKVIRVNTTVTSALVAAATKLEVTHTTEAPESDTRARQDDEEEKGRERAPAIPDLEVGLELRRSASRN